MISARVNQSFFQFSRVGALVTSMVFGPILAKADLQPSWTTQSSVQLTATTQQTLTYNLDVDAERIFFRADSGQMQITDLQIAVNDGSTLSLVSDLISNGRNAEFLPGNIDHSGAPGIPRSVYLDLPKRVHLSSISVSVRQNISPSSMFISVLASTIAPVPPQPPQPPVNPLPPLPPVSPVSPINPPPPPVVNPPMSCDIGGMNQQIGACGANLSALDAQISQSNPNALANQQSSLQQQIASLGYLPGQLSNCQNGNAQLSNQVQAVQQQAQQIRAQADQVRQASQDEMQLIAKYGNPQSRGYVCSITDRHGNTCTNKGPGTPVDVLKPLLMNAQGSGQNSNCSGEGNIGKGDWTPNWHCDPL